MSEKSETNTNIPDHTLANANIPPKDEAPQVYAVSDLRAYVKPELGEELGGVQQLADCGTQVVCQCVPVEGCACNTVQYHAGGCSSTCSCDSQCVSCHPYYYPY